MVKRQETEETGTRKNLFYGGVGRYSSRHASSGFKFNCLSLLKISYDLRNQKIDIILSLLCCTIDFIVIILVLL